MDKLKLLLWIALIGAVGYSVKSCQRAVNEWSTWSADTTRLFTQLEVDRLISDSLKSATARLDSTAERLLETANRQGRSIQQLKVSNQVLRDSLERATNAPDSLDVALGLTETLQATTDTLAARSFVLEAIIAVRDSQFTVLRVDRDNGWRNADSLSALIRRTPKCPRFPLVNLPMPRLGVGFAVTSGGSGVGVALTIPIGGCR